MKQIAHYTVFIFIVIFAKRMAKRRKVVNYKFRITSYKQKRNS